MNLNEALNTDFWKAHKLGDTYTMDGKPDAWKIAYYPIFEDGKTREVYTEPKALVERPGEWPEPREGGKIEMVQGTDFREVPTRYLTKISPHWVVDDIAVWNTAPGKYEFYKCIAAGDSE